MARRITKEEKEERIKVLVAAILAEEEAEGSEDRQETIDDIEDAMIRIGDAVAGEVGVQKLARHTGGASGPHPCPHCGHTGIYVKRHSRELISSRGKVPLTEAKHHCPKCRRNFFPSDGPVGN
jgi:predicted RNA-binding Zn-ribbon protein involved in translation (DUF1610 family)